MGNTQLSRNPSVCRTFEKFCNSLLVASHTPLNTIASMLGRSVNGLSTYIHRVTEPSVLSEASKALLVFDEEIEVFPEDEEAVFDEFIK